MLIQMSFGSMDTAVQQINATYQNLISNYQQLQSIVGRIQGAWPSVDSSAYMTQQQRWNNAVQPMDQQLRQHGQRIDNARQTMSAARASVIRSWGG